MKTAKRIGIVTIAYDKTYNYGNRFQMYALQEFLRSRGIYAETMRYCPDYGKVRPAKELKFWQRGKLQFWADVHRVLKRYVFCKKLNELHQSREAKFESFIQKHICLSEEVFAPDSDFSKLAAQFDCFITGSDQVWNPYWDGTNEYFFLPFVPKEKRIAYAPSIGTDHIPEDMREEFEHRVKGINYLSVREDVAKELLLREFNLNAKLVCDPVFLLSGQQWEAIAHMPKMNGKYFATYLLGRPDVYKQRKIKQLRKRTALPEVDVFRWDNPHAVFAGPEEFIGWIRNAEFLVTDSFHGLAFANLLQTPVVVIDRDTEMKTSMGSRMESLLRLAGLKNRGIDHILSDLKSINQTMPIENSVLADLIEASKEYLMDAIQGCETV